jgi:hypothetical protein
MRLAWIDPLPTVDVTMPLGLEPNPETFPAGEVELDFHLPLTISKPFSDLVESVGDRVMLDEDAKNGISASLTAQSFFKASRQLYSTMLDHEKSANQPLKAVYYDETPVPAHMAGALGIIGHIETKVGKVIVKDAPTLFKRWIAQGLQYAPGTEYEQPKRTGPQRDRNTEPYPQQLVWLDEDGRTIAQRLARERINTLTDQRYDITLPPAGQNQPDQVITVSMPKLTDQPLDEYYDDVNDRVPNADDIRLCIAILEIDKSDWKEGTIGHDHNFVAACSSLGLHVAPDKYSAASMREAFEDWIASYTLEYRPRLEAILKTSPPPAGSTGFGAQTVSSHDTVARWQFPLSDADVNIGFLFSPAKSFTLHPRIVGYSKRRTDTASAMFAQQDGKAFV